VRCAMSLLCHQFSYSLAANVRRAQLVRLDQQDRRELSVNRGRQVRRGRLGHRDQSAWQVPRAIPAKKEHKASAARLDHRDRLE
jgi:hypothetical protein